MIKIFTPDSTLGLALRKYKSVQILEILTVFVSAFIILKIGQPIAGDNPVMRQVVVWIANIAMLVLVWAGLMLRGQNWKDIGLSLSFIKLKTFFFSLIVFILAVVGFIIGSIIMANIVGIPESADMSRYNYLQGNLTMLIGALIAIFIVSSFGEEVVYRGFLITRISEMGGNSKNWVKISVIISSIIFGLAHFEWGLMGIVQTGFMGIALGISFILFNRNLWILVFAHAYMDAILMVQMYLGVKM